MPRAHYIALLARDQSLDAETCWLIAVLMHAQQAGKGPVALTNRELMRMVKVEYRQRLEAIRTRAIASGWLNYTPGHKGQPGTYLVTAPDPENRGAKITPYQAEIGDENMGNKITPYSPETGKEIIPYLEPETKPPDTQPSDSQGVAAAAKRNGRLFDVDEPEPVGGEGGGVFTARAMDIQLQGHSAQPNAGKRASSKRARDDRANEVRDVFAHYRKHHPRAIPRPSSKSKEWKLVLARLSEGYSVSDLCEAIDGCHKSPYHLGENESQTKYLDLELIVRNASKVNRFIEINRQPQQPVLNLKNQRGQRAAESFLAKYGQGGE